MEELSRILNLLSSPNQLTQVDAISIDCFKTGSTIPSKSDLPRYMLRRIMLLDSSSRKLPSVDTLVVPSNALSSLFEEKEDDSIHPMDIFLYLFLISTPIFRQTIVTQLSKCQLSLPLVTHNSDKNEVTLNCFAFETLILNRFVGGNDTRCFSVLEEPLPIISFIRVGECVHSQKSETLNRILNVRHEYFSHRNCPGSTKKRFLLNGTVEVAWYIPKYKENVNINHQFVMLNLRGDATLYSKQTTFIGEISTIVYVFVPLSMLTGEISSQLEEYQSKFISKVIFLVYMTTKLDLDVIPNVLKDNISIPLKKRNPSEDSHIITKSISDHLTGNITSTTLSQSLEIAKKIGILSDVELYDIVSEQKFVTWIWEDNLENPATNDDTHLANIKNTLLPVQSYFGSWAHSYRELQLLSTDTSSRDVEDYIYNAEKKQKETRSLQLNMLTNPSQLLGVIVSQCKKPSSDIELFICILEEHLNTISRKFLTILYGEYKRQLMMMESYSLKSNLTITERDIKQQEAKTKLSEAADCITRSSLGIEHIFRELGQVYEAFLSSNDFLLKSRVSAKLKYDPTLLPGVIARIIHQGHSFEIVNGDDNHVPLTWVSDVLNKLSDIVGRDKKLFAVSVLGIQSSGKSTLLNAMFGIDFPVSSGRCTRGVFLQVIPIKEEFVNQVGYDFLFLLDTEGLRAPELSGSLSYKRDNEMATFIVGLADLAIINIKGESHSEVQDILQITTIAFMRMKMTLKKPKCIFVHQNVGDIQAKTNLMIARKNLIDTLNEMTLCAAKQENRELEFSQFCDVIEFIPEEDVLYFPSLFEGEPPMTSISSGYVEKAQELREKILISCQNKRFQNLKEWRIKLSEIWNSVLKENFVFSYRNILEVNARVELDSALCCWHSNLIQDMASVKSEFINRLHNVEYDSLQITLEQILDELNTEVTERKTRSDEILNYFFIQHEKKEIFVQWRYNTEHFFVTCKEKELQRIREDLGTIFKIENQKQEIDAKFVCFRTDVVSKLRLMLVKSKERESFNFTEFSQNFFCTEWKEWKSSFKINNSIVMANISSDMQQVFRESSQLKQLDVYNSKQEYIVRKNKFSKAGSSKFMELSSIFSQDKALFNYYDILDYLHGRKYSSEIDSGGTQLKFQSIIDDQTQNIDDFIQRIPKYSNYDINYFFLIIDKCISLISEHNKSEKKSNAHQSILLTNCYIFDFTFFQCCRAIKHFEHLQETFFEQRNFERKLDELESTLEDNFRQLCTGIESENLCAIQLASIVLKGMKGQLEDTVLQLLLKLFKNDPEYGSIYSSRASLQLSVLKELAKKKDFDAYISYINSPFTFIKNYVLRSMRNYSMKQVLLSKILVNINQCIRDFRTQCAKITNSAQTQGIDTFIGWKQHFHANVLLSVRGLKFRDLDILDVNTVKNLKQFSELFLQSLDDVIKDFGWENWITDTLTNYGYLYLEIQENIMNSLIQCKHLCPFCREPCQLSAGVHKHYCGIFHRPQGINGCHYSNSNVIVKEDCTTDIRLGMKFIYKNNSYNYVNYQTINDYFNSWKILGEDSIDSKYWQWVLCTFQKEFVSHYKILPNTSIDKKWSHLTEEDVINDIEKHYRTFTFH